MSSETYHVTTFYHFFDLPRETLQAVRQKMRAILANHDVRGTILIASEGINATLCAMQPNLTECMEALESLTGQRFTQTRSTSPFQAFEKSKVKVKPTLVKLGASLNTPDDKGTYIDPADWNAFVARDDVVMVDTRNGYETHLGTFKDALAPNTRKFNQLPQPDSIAFEPPKDKKLATFCTGGIRCEKYTAWLKEQGYDEVYHLKGGILRYLADIPEEESIWEGSCYVFDERIAVTHGLDVDQTVGSCKACGHALKALDLKSPSYEYGVKCAYCDSHPPANFDLLGN